MNIKSAEYVFAVATRAGSQHRAFIDVENILKKKGKVLDSFFSWNMASNDPKFEDWQPATDEEIADLKTEVQNNLDSIQKIVLNREKIGKRTRISPLPCPPFQFYLCFFHFLIGSMMLSFIRIQSALTVEPVKRSACQARSRW